MSRLLSLLALLGLALYSLLGLHRLLQDRLSYHRVISLLGAALAIGGALLGLDGLGVLLDLPADAPGLHERLLHLAAWFGAGGLGGYLFLHGNRQQRRLEREREERTLLELIAARGGRVTAVELAKDSPYSLAEVGEVLRRLCEQGACELHIGRDGQTVYVFPGFLSAEEKRAAVSISEFHPQAAAAPRAGRSGTEK